MLVVSGIRIPLEEDNGAAVERALKMLRVSPSMTKKTALRRLSIDARHGEITKVCSVLVGLRDQKEERRLAKQLRSAELYETPRFQPKPGGERMQSKPVVVGFGPAGMFAALALAEYGYCPVVLEQGRDVDRRKDDLRQFFETGAIRADSNIQFGEGGAGMFSDGKLTTRISDPLCDYILGSLVSFGAPESVLYEAKPHIGTDLLAEVIKNIRMRILACGGEIRFGAKVRDFAVRNGCLTSVAVDKDSLRCETAIVAAGHSARELFQAIFDRGGRLAAKSFAVGLRIEHLQRDIDRALYGKQAGNPLLPRGEYALSANVGGLPVYTFCMCPGGQVVAAASGANEVVVNGMSFHRRDAANANSAVVAAVSERTFAGNPFEALRFQRRLEQAAFAAGGARYAAPASDVKSFLNGRAGLGIGAVRPSYPLGVEAADLGALLGGEIADPLRMAIMEFSGKIRCFDQDDAILTGVESRTSSPVRILRGESREAEGIAGLFPCGEGSGYAGGIMSSAVDGLRSAVAVIGRYRPF